MSGRVAREGALYMFVDVAGYPNVFCSPKQIAGRRFERDQRVEVRVGFGARGVNAIGLRAV